MNRIFLTISSFGLLLSQCVFAEIIFRNGFEDQPPINLRLNDTGQNGCANVTIGNLTCPQVGFPRQDGDVGRDALARAGQLTKIGGGEAGFDFSKISNSGQMLPASAALGGGPNDWACTRDNVTGLLWEVKVNSASNLRHMGHRYTWYSTDSSINGGNVGALSAGDTCGGTLSQCNTQAYVAAVNIEGLCGFNDWRMPDQGHLFSIVNHQRTTSPIDPIYFVNTAASSYLTGRGDAFRPGLAWCGNNFDNSGQIGICSKSTANRVLLVRGGQ